MFKNNKNEFRMVAGMLGEIADALRFMMTAPAAVNNCYQEYEYRPCYAEGKKALFHRWVNTARPQAPKGTETGENVRYFQHRSTQALVEFEDGTVERVWPQDVKFADHGKFREYSWDPLEDCNGESK